MRCRGGRRPSYAPDSQSKSLVLKPRKLHPFSSTVATPNCAKMAHFRPRNGEGGGREGIRWGHGGGKVGFQCPPWRPLVCHFGTKPPPCFHCQSAIAIPNTAPHAGGDWEGAAYVQPHWRHTVTPGAITAPQARQGSSVSLAVDLQITTVPHASQRKPVLCSTTTCSPPGGRKNNGPLESQSRPQTTIFALQVGQFMVCFVGHCRAVGQ